ncbi:2-(3-amino-3-carboxypropyl)histidine synthase subunit 2 [Hydra vulgaris]|uniref:2-(3-amino-3-carboxypropyl)histidine synthase subunit 2 n=1 Tax=Hydra vulgaris TaxID=6087 RepID=A0ABM4D709_HYDVU
MAELKVAFSPDDSKILEQTTQVLTVDIDDPVSYFEIYESVQFIKDGNFKRVALQFPDELLKYAKFIVSKIEKLTCNKVYVLADTSYGNCCVDEVAASHIQADAIIHYGHSCLSVTEKTPTFYVFGRSKLNLDDFSLCTNKLFTENKVLLLYDVKYYHYVEAIKDLLKKFEQTIDVAHLIIYKKNCENVTTACLNSFTFLGRQFNLKFELLVYKILFIGEECLTLRNLMMRFNKNQFYVYNPSLLSLTLQQVNINKSLMKRFYLIQKAKDAQIVGIVMGTLGIEKYKEIVQRLKKVLKHAGKKYYTFIMGKLNVAKMANFMEIDIFVLVACPENSLIDSKEYFKPIITPFELEIACLNSREWNGEYLTDFCELLEGGPSYLDIKDDDGFVEPEYSLITGQLRSGVNIENNFDSSNEIALINENNKLVAHNITNASDFLLRRTWQGLQISSNYTEVHKAVDGRAGIASDYLNELEYKN